MSMPTTTRKLFEEDAYQTTFEAQVLTCAPAGDRWLVTLDQTCFYPEGGGQPFDLGTLGDGEVVEVHTRNGEILHTVTQPLAPGSRVQGQIDWARRFDLMQQHSGEHIVSGIIYRLLGLDNVGFHMGGDMITVDWNGEITPQRLAEIEAMANAVVWQNLPTSIAVPDPEELAQLEYRSKKALAWPVRIVTFPGVDICACCGTHVRRTGEVGLIKLLSVVKMRGGVRVEMLCGKRALEYCNRILQSNHRISTLLSAKAPETAEAVQRLYDQQQQTRARLAELEALHDQTLATQYQGKGNCLIFAQRSDTNALRRLAVAVMEECGGICAVFSPTPTGYAYCLGQKDGDVRALVKELNRSLNGRGGGKPHFAQGSVQTTRETLAAFFPDFLQ